MPDQNPNDEEISKVTSYSGISEQDESLDENTDLSESNLSNIPGKEKLYSRGVLSTFSAGMVDPFLATIAIDMGITGVLMGWLRAITNLLGTFVQPIFGFFSDKLKRRTIFISISNILYSTTWIVLLFINNVIFLIIMAGFLSLVASLGTPAWTALLGEVIPSKIRGRVIAKFNWFSQFSNIASTIIGGLLLNYVLGDVNFGSWSFPLNIFLTITIGLIAGYASAIVIATFKEKKARDRAQKFATLLEAEMYEKKQKATVSSSDHCTGEPILIKNEDKQGNILSDGVVCISSEEESTQSTRKKLLSKKQISSSNRILKMLSDKDFVKFTVVFGIQSFFMSFCWPLFPIRQRSDIAADYFEIALFSVVMTIAMVLTIRYSGRVSDLIGRKPQMVLNRLILTAMPLGYIFASEVWHIILIHAVICIPLGLNSAVIQVYLIDITPENERSMYVGFFNMFYGVILFLGSLAGGYLVDFLQGEFTFLGYYFTYPQYTAVSIAFMVGFIGRVITALPFFALKEVKKFPYSLKDLPKLILKSKKFPVLIISVVVFFAFIVGFMFIMGYLP